MTEEIAIVGGGIAGALFARSLAERKTGRTIDVYDAADPVRSSDVPGALLHAFPGRSMRPKPGVLDAFEVAMNTARRWRDAGVPVFEGTMIRPAGTSKTGRRLRDSFEATSSFPSWLDTDLVSEPVLHERYPALSGKLESAITYRPAFCVDLPASRRHLLESSGLDIRHEAVEQLIYDDGTWLVRTGRERRSYSQVVIAAGNRLHDWCEGLDLRRYGGDVLELDPAVGGVELDFAWSGGGHVAPLPDGRLVVGSTYWRPGETDDIERVEDRRALLRRLAASLPVLEQATTRNVWSGVRTVLHPDRMPIVGPLGSRDGLWVLGAFGSKGLLWIPRCCEALVAAVVDGAAMPDVISSRRESVEKLRPTDLISR